MSLVTLPQELLFAIAQQLSDRDLSHLAATSKYTLNVLEPSLYQQGLQYVEASTPALVWGTGYGRMATVKKVLADSQPDIVLLFDALMEAAGRGNIDLTKLLLQHGAPTELEPNQRVEFIRRRAVWASAVETACPHTRYWISPTNIEASPLGAAAGRNHPRTVSLLLKHGAQVDAQNEHGDTALRYAALQPAKACIRLLINAGADVNACNTFGMTPFDVLNLRVLRGRPDNASLKLFLEAGASLSGPRSPALDMVSYGDNECKRLVIRYGMPHKSDVPPPVLLLAAAALAYEGTARILLVRYGIDVEATVDKKGRNAVMLAARFGHESTIQLLTPHLTRPIDSFRTKKGHSILHLAVRSGNLSTVQLIASMTNSLHTVRDGSGHTPLSFAAGNGTDLSEITHFLASCTVDLLVRDLHEHLQAHHAPTSEHVSALKVFIPNAQTKLDTLAGLDDLLGSTAVVTILSILLFLIIFLLMLLRLG
ncbi:ankyrin repeat-containing domain protein [Aspergillus carlsbadensis]|nr:ankyrin repeat-containing domain protein [Aspergillus carlsbadensis]